jgi:hypothetical protein
MTAHSPFEVKYDSVSRMYYRPTDCRRCHGRGWLYDADYDEGVVCPCGAMTQNQALTTMKEGEDDPA